jgi:hypothetical protein
MESDLTLSKQWFCLVQSFLPPLLPQEVAQTDSCKAIPRRFHDWSMRLVFWMTTMRSGSSGSEDWDE